jgi:2-dehydropantoate 2-reductase
VKLAGHAHVAGGTAYVWAVIGEPGTIRHTVTDHLIFGELDGSRTPRLERLLDACRGAGFQATLTDQIGMEIWSKFVHLAAFSGMTTVTRSPVGVLRDNPDLWAMSQAAVMEVMAVAHARQIALPPNLFNRIVSQVQELPPQAKSSMLQDLERGRPLELPWLSGAVVRLAQEVGVDTPIHRFIATVLAPYVHGSITRRTETSPDTEGFHFFRTIDR